MREAVIVAGARSAIGKAGKGSLRELRADELAAAVIQGTMERAAGLAAADVDDVILGCATPEEEQGMNVARIALLRAGLPARAAGVTVNRFCSSGLQSIAQAVQSIAFGSADVVIAGGVESMSRLPMGGRHVTPNPHLTVHYPEVYLSMGATAEEVARRFDVTRDQQDEFALRSHQRAARAIDEGRTADQIVPVRAPRTVVQEDGRPLREEQWFSVDEGVRRDTSLEALSKLRPAFARDGSVTAGNSSQTSDGAAMVVAMSATAAQERGLRPIAAMRSYAVVGVEPDVMGLGPITAVPRALAQAGLTLADIDLIELNEAFAAQAVQVIRELDLDGERVNVNGGAIALGHPLGCTGARQAVDLFAELRRRGGRYGVVTMCVGGGMGAAAVFELL